MEEGRNLYSRKSETLYPVKGSSKNRVLHPISTEPRHGGDDVRVVAFVSAESDLL